MIRSMIQLAAWCGVAVGVFAMLFGGTFAGGTLAGDNTPGGLIGTGPWATLGAALIGLAVCVNAVTQVRSTAR